MVATRAQKFTALLFQMTDDVSALHLEVMTQGSRMTGRPSSLVDVFPMTDGQNQNAAVYKIEYDPIIANAKAVLANL